MYLKRSDPKHFWSEIIAAPDPERVRAPRYITWPSVCDTTRTNWLSPAQPQSQSQLQSPLTETSIIDVRCHVDSLPLLVSLSPPLLVSRAATPAQQSAFARYSFSHDAAPTPAPGDLYTTIISAPGVAPPAIPKSRSKRGETPKKPKKRGRPVIFDEIKRAEFLGMVKSGCTIRHAARRVGITHVAVLKACRHDPLLADRLARAEQERDALSVRRIHNAGEKSWRAAAWLLERNEPNEFSLQHKNRDPWTARGQRRLQKFVTDIVNRALSDRLETRDRQSNVNRALQLIDDRLAEIESQCGPYDELDNEEPELEHPELEHMEPQDDQLEDDELDDDDPDPDFDENDGFESEQAAIASYRQLLRKLNVDPLSEQGMSHLESYRRRLRKLNRRRL